MRSRCASGAHAIAVEDDPVDQKAPIETMAPRAKDFANQRVHRNGEIDEIKRASNRNKPKVRPAPRKGLADRAIGAAIAPALPCSPEISSRVAWLLVSTMLRLVQRCP